MTLRKEKPWRVPSSRVFTALVRRASRCTSVPKQAAVGLAFIGDRTMQRLNATYRKKPKTTDVLSFCTTKTRTVLEGDLVISVPQARRQAQAIGQSLGAEIAFLFVHGFLHLLGYDHERSTAEEHRMFVLQDKILGRK